MNLELKLNRDIIPTSEVIYDGIQEQGVDLQYILPDYLPDIYRMIKCDAVPFITSYSLSENKLCYELGADVCIWYCSEGSNQLNTLRQKLTFSKSLEIGKDISMAQIHIKPCTDYINCRVVNRKRVDVKGLLTVRINILCDKKQEIICNAEGLNLQLKKNPLEYILSKLSSEKTFTIAEDIETGTSKSKVISVARVSVFTDKSDTRIVSDKLVVKGSADINILYTCEENGVPSMENLKYTLPYSHIFDIEGLDENYTCFADITAADCDVTPTEGQNGSLLKCELTLKAVCTAFKTAHTEVITDLYSTKYQTDYISSDTSICQPPVVIDEHFNEKCSIDYNDETIDKVYDVWCSVKNASIKPELTDKTTMISGMLKYSVLFRNSEGMPVLVEKEKAFEQKINFPESQQGFNTDAEVCSENSVYNLVSGNKISITTDISVRGRIYSCFNMPAITSVDVKTDISCKKDACYAIRLYFGNEGESIWDISKRYCTSVRAVMEENDLYDEKLSGNSMLLIPIVN